jgi:hypothetical protein
VLGRPRAQAIEQVLIQGRAVLGTPLAHRQAACAAANLCVGELHDDEPYRRAACAAADSAPASSTTMNLRSSEHQGDIALKAHIASVCFKYFRCFIWMLQK